MNERAASVATDVGYVSTVCRSTSFSNLWGIALSTDDAIYVSDYNNHCIWRVDASSGDVTSYAGAAGQKGSEDGPTDTARFKSPIGLASSGSILYVCDSNNHVVRTINDGAVSTLAGSGDQGERDTKHLLTDAQFSNPKGIAVKDETVVVSCVSTIREIKIGKEVRTLAGIPYKPGYNDGACSEATFTGPHQLAMGPDGSVYVSDTGNMALRKITNGQVETVCKGLNGNVCGVAVDDDGNVYFSDSSRIYKLALSGEKEIVCGLGAAKSVDGQGELASLNNPRHLCYDDESCCLYFTEPNAVRRVRVGPASFKSFHDDNLSSDFSKLIDCKDTLPTGEAVFMIEGKRIEVVAKILCVRSEYFNKMFSSTWKSFQGESTPIVIEEATYDSFYAVVTFLTTGCLEVQKYLGSMPDILVLADRFLLENLRNFCVKHLAKRVTFRTALDYLSLADTYGFQLLRDVCVQFVAKNARVLCHDAKFEDLGSQLLVELFRLALK
ncbi:uncharacterized protein [Oscarella lobularis]|uniref:uncharacterized protein n=1 Tax=Oscarella lobularis TaxID=121494 RepID=UPI003313AA3A